MKESGKNRTEYQVFLNSLFVKYSIESPDESWSNSLWKVIVNSRLSDFDRENFYKELSEFNIKNPSDENWTHLSHEELKAAERYSVEDIKKAAERKKIADAKKMKKTAELKKIADAKKVKDMNKESERKRIADAKNMKKTAERKRIADAKKVKDMHKAPKRKRIADAKSMKKCPSCKEEIKQDANKCRYCGDLQDTEEVREMTEQNNYQVEQAGNKIFWLVFLSYVSGPIIFFSIVYFAFFY